MKHKFEIGDCVRCMVTGEYVIEQEVTGIIQHFYGTDRAKIKTATGHCYMVHLEDCKTPMTEKSIEDMCIFIKEAAR